MFNNLRKMTIKPQNSPFIFIKQKIYFVLIKREKRGGKK